MELILKDFKTKEFKKCQYTSQDVKELVFEDPDQQEEIKKLTSK
jgi:hypothetical protein